VNRLISSGRWWRRCLGRDDGTVVTPAILDALAVDSRRARGSVAALTSLPAAVIVDPFQVEGVDMAGEVTKNGQADIDQKISTAARDDEDTDRRQENGDEHQEDGGAGTHSGRLSQ